VADVGGRLLCKKVSRSLPLFSQKKLRIWSLDHVFDLMVCFKVDSDITDKVGILAGRDELRA